MKKPGSHRGAASVKKKRYITGYKKEAILVVEKLRKFCSEIKVEAEKNSKTNTYTKTHFLCRDMAKKFKCRIGEVVKAVEILCRENITSKISKRYLSFEVFYDDEKDKGLEPKDIDVLFNKEFCPICGSFLFKGENRKKSLKRGKDGKYESDTRSILVSFKVNCKNTCFSYDTGAKDHLFKIFGNDIVIDKSAHISVINHKLKLVKKEISRFKKNERYITEIMMKDF